MAIVQHAYNVLIVTSADKFYEQLTPILPESVIKPVTTVKSVNEAQRKLADRMYDLIIINTPLSDDFGVRFSIDVSSNGNSVAMLLVKSDVYDAVYDKVYESGVFVVRKPTSASVMQQAFDWLIATRERLRKLEKKSVSLQEKMDEIKLVNRAKWVLITNLNMPEDAAHRYIEKQAMDRCVSRRTIAEDILRTYKE